MAKPWEEYASPGTAIRGPWDAYSQEVSAPDASVEKHSNTGWDWEQAKANYFGAYGDVAAAVGGAVGSEGLKRYGNEVRNRNAVRAEAAGAQSTDPQSWAEMQFGDGEKGFLPYARRLAIGSAPYMAEIAGYAGADALTGGALTPAIVARYGARAAPLFKGAVEKAVASGMTQEAAVASVGRGLARTAMIPAISYPQSLGDVLSNQYDQNKEYNLFAAAPLAAGYSAFNVAGLQGAMARGFDTVALKGLMRSGLAARAGRAGVEAGVLGLEQGGQEVGQELMNQAGRVAVDPTASMTSPEALNRYKESFIGGAVLGGIPGGIHGATTRGEKVELLKKPTEETIYPTEGRTPDIFTGEMGLPKAGVPAQEEVAPTEQRSIYDDLFPPAPIRTTTGGAPTLGVWSGKSPKKIAAEAARAAKTEEKLTEAVKTEAAKTGKGIPVMTPTALLKARLDKHLAAGEITDIQHQDITNAIDSYGGKNRGRMLAKANKEINDALQVGSAAQVVAREQTPGSQPGGVGQIIGGPQAPGEIQVTTAKGTTTVAPKEKVNRGKKGRIPVAMPVATEPVPILPTDATKVPDYEKAMVSYVTSGVDPKNLAVVLHVRGLEQDGVEEGGASLRVVAKQNKTSHEQVRKQYLAGLSQLKANAQAAGMDWDMAQELLGIAPPAAIETGLGEGAHNLGEAVKAVMPESDEFEHTAGTARDETAGEEAPTEAVPEELPAEAEVSTEDTLASKETQDRAEEILAKYDPDYLDLAEAAYGAGFRDLSPWEQSQYVADVVDAHDRSGGSDVAFVQNIKKLNGERDAKKIVASPQTSQGLNEGPSTEEETGPSAQRDEAVPAKKSVTIQVKKKRTIIKPSEDKLSTGKDTFQGTTKKYVEDVIKKAFFSLQKMDQLVTIFDTTEEALKSSVPSGKAKAALSSGDRVGGWKSPDGHVYLVAENIYDDERTILGVFLHEVGVHLGMEKLIGKANMEALASKVEEWAQLNDGSEENLRARAAVARARADIESPHYREELVAYMVSELVESGVTPQALGMSEGHKWFRKLWAAAKAALRHLGLRIEKFTPQNLVDLAYGAADLEMRKETQIGASQADEAIKFSISAPMEAAARFAGPTGEKIVSEASGALKVAAGHIEFLHNIVDRVKKTLPSAKIWHDAMLKMQSSREILERKAEEVAVAFGKLKLKERDQVNSFIAKSTKDQKWGYQPTWKTDAPVDPEMEKAWNKLSAEQQNVVDSVFKHGEETSNRINALFKSLGIEGIFTKMGKLEGPYAPLMRFGNFVGVAKSQVLLDAEKTASAEDATTGELDRVEELKKDEKHFWIEHFDTRSQADQFAKTAAQKYAFTDSFAKSSQTENKNSIGYKQLSRVMAALKADQDIPAAAKAAIEDTINAMYMASVDQHSARASMQKRGGYAGFEKDMIRSFLANARAQAGFISNLEFGPEVNNAFYAMREEVKDQATGKRVNQDDLNRLTEHYAENMNNRATPITDRIVGLTSAMQLATSIGYHLNNLSQVLMVTGPQLAADFNDYPGMWKHIFTGYATAKKIWKGGKFNLEMLGTGSGLYKALKVIESRQLLDVGMEENLGHYERFRTGFAAADKATTVASNALHKLRQISRTVEMVNRISSATAAYNMALEHGMNHEAAQDYAIGIVENTQGNFTRMDAPLVLKKMGPAGKVIGQYRKFQLLMMSFYMRAYSSAFKGATAEERAIGKRMLAYKLFHTSVAAGVLGFPLMNLAAFAFGLAGGDEPDDLEAWAMDKMEALVGDKDLAKMLLRGPLSYVGFGTKLGDDRVFSILPYSDIDFTSKAGVAKTLAGAAGPAFGQLGSFADGVGFMQRGDMYKGIEKFMPKGITSAMQSFRFANDGYTLKNGDVMVKPEDLSEFSLALHAVGMTAPQIMDIQRTQNLQYQINTYYADKTKELEHRFAEARRDHDTAEMGQIRQEWIEMQKSKDEQRKHFNFSHDALKKQPLSNLLKYPQIVRKRERALQREVPK